LKSNSDYAFKKKELASILRVKSKHYPQFRNELKSLNKLGSITKVHGGRFIYTSPESYLIGNLSISKSGKGFVDGEEKSAFVGSGQFGGALHGDTVKVKIKYEYEDRINGEVIETLSRSNKIIQGYVQKKYNRFILEPSHKLANRGFVIQDLKGIEPEDFTWVEAEVINWEKPPKEIPVKITKIIGDSQNPKMDLQIITSKYKLDLKFPEEVKTETAIYSSENVINAKSRIDLTKLPTITIDPETAKDHDDAISIRELKNNTEVGIHIADVSEYVIEKSAIDKEAKKRGTSVYFPDYCVSMLPEELSNGLCSLKEKENRFALSLLVELNPKYDIVKFKLVESIINVDKKYSYEQIGKIDEDDQYYKPIEKLQKITNYLRKNRIKSGSLDFNIPEAEIKIGKDGIPEQILQKEILDSHHLIEELMLLANKIIAKNYGQKFKGFPFRNHEKPKEIDVKEIRQTLIQSNTPKDVKQKLIQKNITLNKMFNAIKGLKTEKLFAQLALRAMPKANYYPKNKGHFGLSFNHYCHFTSPIRRYPDLIVHRFLKKMINNKEYKLKDTKNISRECSRLEVNAMNAERDYIKRKQLRFLSNYIGEYFFGVISGLTPKGLFIQLDEILVDGFVSLKSLLDDYYIYEPSKYIFRGRRYKKEYHIGDAVEIKVVNVNIQLGMADFEMVD